MAAFPFRNLGLKALSICIAVLLWLVVADERVVERVLHAPVAFQNLPAGLELVGAPPDTVEVRVRGTSSALSRLAPGDLSTVVDLRTGRPGRRLFQLTPGQVSVPYGIEVAQVAPSTLVIEFDTTGTRVVSVEPVIYGRAASGFEVTRVTAEPSSVEVEGPDSALKRLKFAITEPVSIANQSRNVREAVTIGVADASLRLKEPMTAMVTVTIAPVKRP